MADGEVVPGPYEEGVEIGLDLYREGVSLASLAPLSIAARRFGYVGEREIRAWVRGVVHGYAKGTKEAPSSGSSVESRDRVEEGIQGARAGDAIN